MLSVASGLKFTLSELHALDQSLMSLDGERERPWAIDRLIDPIFFSSRREHTHTG